MVKRGKIIDEAEAYSGEQAEEMGAEVGTAIGGTEEGQETQPRPQRKQDAASFSREVAKKLHTGENAHYAEYSGGQPNRKMSRRMENYVYNVTHGS